MIAEGFFPTLIYAQDVNLNTQQLANDIIVWSKQDEGMKKTNVYKQIFQLHFIPIPTEYRTHSTYVETRV